MNPFIVWALYAKPDELDQLNEVMTKAWLDSQKALVMPFCIALVLAAVLV